MTDTIMNICPICNEPFKLNQCGYHLDTQDGPLSLHVSCGEAEREVYCVSIAGDELGSELCYGTCEEALKAIDIMLGESDIDEGYSIVKHTMSNNKYYSLKEFTGF